MAKKKEDSAEEAETKKSIGSQMTGKLTQRERNLKVKQEMIDRGEREEPLNPSVRTQKEKNLMIKGKKNVKEEEDDKGKGKGKGKA